MECGGRALEVGATGWCRSLLPNLVPDVNAVIAVPPEIPIPPAKPYQQCSGGSFPRPSPNTLSPDHCRYGPKVFATVIVTAI